MIALIKIHVFIIPIKQLALHCAFVILNPDTIRAGLVDTSHPTEDLRQKGSLLSHY